MTKYLLLAIGLWLSVSTYGQPISGPAAVAGYSPAEKQLLVRSTAAFIQLLNQQSLDEDTVMSIACGISGVPFLLAWAEEPDSTSFSPGAQWINAGKIAQAVRLFRSLQGGARIQLAMELATWYLHQPGAYKKDLDSAKQFIRSANDPLDSTDLSYLDKALSGFQNAQKKAKEIECLFLSSMYHLRMDLSTCKHEHERVLDLQRYLRFRHTLFAQYLLANVLSKQAKDLEAMGWADSISTLIFLLAAMAGRK
jgi:hypothetical protein